ncbi:hypothetical protein F4775DRAFT_497054 [Biscogniauxia sp. FL1348]|nr:hypothetical protein F4775DRAFT_497054 [Biscogniauxia sp. FL1348]
MEHDTVGADKANKDFDLTPQDKAVFEDIETKQIEFHAWLKKKNLAPEIEGALDCRKYEDFVSFWSNTSQNAHSTFLHKHDTGWRKFAKASQGFAAEMNSFMENMKPMLDIVKEFGSPYTGAAIGTITGLFMIVGNKNNLDNMVYLAITSIRDRIPGFKVYENIYWEKTDLRKIIVLSYVAFIDLSMSITKYCLQPGYRRWTIATFNPTKLQNKLNSANEAVARVRMRCEELLGENVNELKKMLNKIKLGLLHTIKAGMMIKGFDFKLQHEELLKYRDSLLSESEVEAHLFDQMSPNRIAELQRTKEFTSWSSSEKSGVMLLHGHNNHQLGQAKRSSWLSPFTVDHIIRLQDPSFSDPYGYYIFHVANTSIHNALPIVLFHLLNHRLCNLGPSEARGKLQEDVQFYKLELENRKIRDRRSSEQDDGKLGANLQKVAFGVLSLFEPNQTVHLVMDRIDRCRPEEQYEMMDILGYLVQEVACNLKILLVLDSVGWGVSTSTYRRTFGGRLECMELRQEIADHGNY